MSERDDFDAWARKTHGFHALSDPDAGSMWSAWQARAALAQQQQASNPAADVDAIVSSLYRRFKDWSRRGFGPEDVTWCEVKAEVMALLASAPPAPQAEQPRQTVGLTKRQIQEAARNADAAAALDNDRPRIEWEVRVALAAMAGVYEALPEWDIRGVLSGLKCWHRLTEEEAADLVEFARRHGIGTAKPAQPEEGRPDIIERLTYHAMERDDLTLDECLRYLSSGWKTVRGRNERQMVMQILAMLATQPDQGVVN